MRGGDVERFDLTDLLALAASSRAALGTVVRGARDHARELGDRRRDHTAARPRTRRERRAAAKQRRFRFKRRWVVVPLVVLVLVVLVLGTIALLVTGVVELP